MGFFIAFKRQLHWTDNNNEEIIKIKLKSLIYNKLQKYQTAKNLKQTNKWAFSQEMQAFIES